MSLVQKYISLILSSDPANGALNISNGNSDAGSRFQVSLNGGLRVPTKALACDMWVQEATLWWTMLNIITDVNNGFQFTHSTVAYGTTVYALTIDQGIYDVQNLYDALNRAFLNHPNFGLSDLTGLPFQLIPNDSTQKIVIQFTESNTQINYNGSTRGMLTLLGFTIEENIPYDSTSVAGQSFTGSSVARFNTIDNFLLNVPELANGGLPVNNIQYNTLAKINITVPAGYQLNFTPNNPTILDASHLIGRNISNLNVSLTDQAGQPVNTNSEHYSFTVVIRYSILV